jgi:hypothetical protein
MTHGASPQSISFYYGQIAAVTNLGGLSSIPAGLTVRLTFSALPPIVPGRSLEITYYWNNNLLRRRTLGRSSDDPYYFRLSVSHAGQIGGSSSLLSGRATRSSPLWLQTSSPLFLIGNLCRAGGWQWVHTECSICAPHNSHRCCSRHQHWHGNTD